ncbi:MAG: cbb3-type cytochrome c oxidase subunit I [Anaerolineales bacterium]|nr:cbb3-type cytochrome c oxidase subunit I [Anaerolineales bacterium]
MMSISELPVQRLVRRYGSAQDRISTVGQSVTEHSDRATLMWLYSAIVWLTIVDLFGLILALELISPNLFAGVPWLLFGRVRPLHVNGVIFAWLSMMYWGALFYMIPRLTGLRAIWNEKLAIWTCWGWNLWFLLGIITIAMGLTQGREYAEFIWPLDILLILLWTSNIVNIIMTVAQRRIRPLYVTTWWALAAPLWLGADYIIGNVIWRPGAVFGNGVSGALPTSMADGILNWWYAHNLFGLWLTPMLLAGLYYLVPRITRTPLYSHTLSLISFWGMAFFYTGVGHHHLLQTPTPGWLKTIAILSSISLLIPVFAFTINILMTMRGNWEKFFTNLPLRFGLTGFVFYFLVNVQGSFEAIQSFNRLTHFTNFVVAHAHLALLGAFTFLGMGMIDYIIPQVLKKPLYSAKLAEWQYWLIVIGFLGFFWALTIAGFIQGQAWLRGIPEVNVIPFLRPYYMGRAIFGAMIVFSGAIQAYNIFKTVTTDTRHSLRMELQAALPELETIA